MDCSNSVKCHIIILKWCHRCLKEFKMVVSFSLKTNLRMVFCLSEGIGCDLRNILSILTCPQKMIFFNRFEHGLNFNWYAWVGNKSL